MAKGDLDNFADFSEFFKEAFTLDEIPIYKHPALWLFRLREDYSLEGEEAQRIGGGSDHEALENVEEEAAEVSQRDLRTVAEVANEGGGGDDVEKNGHLPQNETAATASSVIETVSDGIHEQTGGPSNPKSDRTVKHEVNEIDERKKIKMEMVANQGDAVHEGPSADDSPGDKEQSIEVTSVEDTREDRKNKGRLEHAAAVRLREDICFMDSPASPDANSAAGREDGSEGEESEDGMRRLLEESVASCLQRKRLLSESSDSVEPKRCRLFGSDGEDEDTSQVVSFWEKGSRAEMEERAKEELAKSEERKKLKKLDEKKEDNKEKKKSSKEKKRTKRKKLTRKEKKDKKRLSLSGRLDEAEPKREARKRVVSVCDENGGGEWHEVSTAEGRPQIQNEGPQSDLEKSKEAVDKFKKVLEKYGGVATIEELNFEFQDRHSIEFGAFLSQIAEEDKEQFVSIRCDFFFRIRHIFNEIDRVVGSSPFLPQPKAPVMSPLREGVSKFVAALSDCGGRAFLEEIQTAFKNRFGTEMDRNWLVTHFGTCNFKEIVALSYLSSKMTMRLGDDKKHKFFLIGDEQVECGVSQMKRVLELCGGAATLSEMQQKAEENHIPFDTPWLEYIFNTKNFEELKKLPTFNVQIQVIANPYFVFRLQSEAIPPSPIPCITLSEDNSPPDPVVSSLRRRRLLSESSDSVEPKRCRLFSSEREDEDTSEVVYIGEKKGRAVSEAEMSVAAELQNDREKVPQTNEEKKRRMQERAEELARKAQNVERWLLTDVVEPREAIRQMEIPSPPRGPAFPIPLPLQKPPAPVDTEKDPVELKKEQLVALFGEFDGECTLADLREANERVFPKEKRALNRQFFDDTLLMAKLVGFKLLVDNNSSGEKTKLRLVNKVYEGRRRMKRVLEEFEGAATIDTLSYGYQKLLSTSFSEEMKAFFGADSMPVLLKKLGKNILYIHKGEQFHLLLAPQLNGFKQLFEDYRKQLLKRAFVDAKEEFNNQCFFINSLLEQGACQLATYPTPENILAYFDSLGGIYGEFSKFLRECPRNLLKIILSHRFSGLACTPRQKA